MKRSGVFYGSFALSLFMLGGCASSGSSVQKDELMALKTAPFKVIVTERYPTQTAKDPFFDLVAESCNCPPVYAGRYSTSGYLYEISLPTDMTFSGFRTRMLDRSNGGITNVELYRELQKP